MAATKKITALDQATNAAQGDDDLVPIIVDPSGTPITKKTTLSRIGAAPKSFLDELAAGHSFAAVAAGDFSTGMQFCARRSGQQCTGVRFYWNSGTPRTVTCTLWLGGAAQKTVDVSVNGVGYYTGTFSGANSITRNQDWFVSIWEKSGAEYALHATISRMPNWPTRMRDIFVINTSLYAVGNAEPGLSVSATGAYPVEPVITG